MAEFCKDCFLRMNGNTYANRIILSRDLDICEGCGEWKRVVEEIRYAFNESSCTTTFFHFNISILNLFCLIHL